MLIRTVVALAALAAAPAPVVADNSAAHPLRTQVSGQNGAAGEVGRGAFLESASGEQFRAGELLGAPVTTTEGQGVGRIEDLLSDEQGRLVAAVISVGGFLGLGQKRVAVPWPALAYQRAERGADPPLKVVLDRTREQLEAAPMYRRLREVPRDQHATDSRQQMLDTLVRGQLQRALQAVEGAQQALGDQNPEAAQRALEQAREALEYLGARAAAPGGQPSAPSAQ